MACVRIKVCGIRNLNEAELAVDLGASALGFVSDKKCGDNPLALNKIRRIVSRTPPMVESVLLTVATSSSAVTELHRQCRTTAIQLSEMTSAQTRTEIRGMLPGVRIIQVVYVEGPTTLSQVQALSGPVDAITLDTPSGTDTRGGTGRTHDWLLSRKIRQLVKTPVILAGGLTGDNIREAIATVVPFGVDVCSGIRTDGSLDEAKLRLFVQQTHYKLP